MNDPGSVSLVVINLLMIVGIGFTAYGTIVEEDPWSAIALMGTIVAFFWMNW